MAFNRSLMVTGFSVLACFLVPASSLQMSDPASRGGKDWMRGLPQENYSLSISVDFHASWLLLMLFFVLQIVSLPSGFHTICHEQTHRTTYLLNR